jgi:hypothetical protein
MRRWPQVEIRHPVFPAQVFQVQPDGLALAPCHRRDVHRGQLAAEGLDHHVGNVERVTRMRRRVPVLDRHAFGVLGVDRGIDRGAERVEGLQVVDEQAHLPVVLGTELAGEPPADADVTEVVDDRAENVAGDARRGG